MRICIDLGTARTALAIREANGNWLSLPRQASQSRVVGRPNDALATFIRAIHGVEERDTPIPHLIVKSRYARLGNLVVPFCYEGSFVAVPKGISLYPGSNRGDAFENIKENEGQVEPFLKAVTQFAAALQGEGAQWTIGRSAGGVDLARVGLPRGSRSHNEAVAVVFSLVSHELSRHADAPPSFLVVADLGGGFLDVSVAHDIQFEERRSTARISNYGGYPLGVDRLDPQGRFSRSLITNPDPLIELVALVINYHIWDHVKQLDENAGSLRGLVALTGGGFKRLVERQVKERLKERIETFAAEVIGAPIVNLQFRIPQQDTKYLTLAGLGRMDEDERSDDEDDNRNISKKRPNFYGTEVLRWSNIQAATAENWSALLDHERRERYVTPGVIA